jgi:hypothetical protein
MNRRSIFILAFISTFLFRAELVRAQDFSKSVVNVYATTIEYDYYSPWQIKRQSNATLQGTVIDSAKGYILTLSHPLFNSVQLEVSKLGDERRYTASVYVSDYTTGLAIVKVDEKGFFKDLAQVKLIDRRTKLGSASIAKWDDQDIFKSYACEPLKTSVQSYDDFGVALFHEMTTSLDAGGEGEPVFQGGRLVGIVAWFDSRRKTVKINSFETIGWLLAEISSGKSRGQPFFYIRASYLRGDENLKEYVGLAPSDTGIAIESIPVSSSGSQALRPEDVILAIDRQNVDDIGYCMTPEYGKLNFLWLVGLKHHVGDTLSVTLMRDKKRLSVSFPLVASTGDSFLVPPEYFDPKPRYLVSGGLVFQELSKPYMEIWGDEWEKKGDKRFLRLITNEWASPSKDRRRITILNRVLPADVNAGYHDMANLVLASINGTKVRDLAHAKELIDGSKGEFVIFGLSGNETIVLKRSALASSTAEVLARYGIPAADNLDR